ncbi:MULTISPECIES: hypothetical protein [Larkinella]|jgi:hypothetical protein|uniref:Uncharacterized protein n=1 Tax=Larkinella punicea TaxID=2315727 RepID=A0A368JMH3_9BACT|nr:MULTISPECIES: hypothetical protein [Larkinella]RCR68858.1 hypothetical protein DUE52_15370 [Larkinella punicea]
MLHRPKPNRYYLIHNEPVLLTETLLKELQPPNRPQPIKLTKPWLIAFGYWPDPSANSWIFEDSRLIPGMNCWLCVQTRRYLQYVHELQDLFEEEYEYTELRLRTDPNKLHLPTIRQQLA